MGLSGQSSKRRTALLVEGSLWQIAPRLVSLLHRAGWIIDVMARPQSAMWSSSHVARRFPLVADPALVSVQLREHLGLHRYDRVIVTDEPTLLRLAAQGNLDYPQAVFPVTACIENLQKILLKTSFLQACWAGGLSTPKVRICTSPADLLSAAEAVGYPIIFKSDGAFSGQGVQRFDTPESLRAGLGSFRHCFPGVVQQFIRGIDGSTAVLYRRGKPLAWDASYKSLVYPEPFGPSCVRTAANNSQMPALVEGIGRLTEFDGMCGFGWLEEPTTKRLYIIEFSPRIIAHSTAAFQGVDFAKAWKRFELPEDINLPPLIPRSPAQDQRRIWMFPQYPIRCIETERWSDLLRMNPWRSDIPWRDPALALFLLRYAMTILRRQLKPIRYRWKAWFRSLSLSPRFQVK